MAGTSITYNALFSDAVQANNVNHAETVDPTTLTDVKVAFFPDSVAHTYDFCITKIEPLTAAPSPVVPTGNYGPTWNNQTAQAVNGVNGYAVQSAPFSLSGDAITMQVTGGTTAGHVGFTYTPGANYPTNSSMPTAFPAIISGWGPGVRRNPVLWALQGRQDRRLTHQRANDLVVHDARGPKWETLPTTRWFSNAATQPPPSPAFEFMVWLNKGGKSPLGSTPAGAKTVTIGSTTWTPSVGTNTTGQAVVSYVPSSDANSGSLDLLQFFKAAAADPSITSQYQDINKKPFSTTTTFLGVQAGFEVYGGTTWTTTDYTISIQ